MAGVSHVWWMRVSLLLAVCSLSDSHIVLTYPPARHLALDFLDNVRTQGPCGMAKGNGPVTDIEAGSTIRVTWHLAYIHRGGYSLELRNRTDAIILRVPNTSYIGASNTTLSHHELALPPDLTCYDCTLRVVRQALDWSTPTFKYNFWSCADVYIVPPQQQPPKIVCLNGGMVGVNGRCRCTRLYRGANCQYKDDCEDASDCHNYGQCIDTESTSYPIFQCFCKAGYFGRFCNQSSLLSSRITSYDGYIHTGLSSGFDLYHRVLQNMQELEVVLRVKSKSWVAIGIRPKGNALPEPGTAEPGTPEPGTPEPGTPEPGTPEPGTPEPGTAEPGTPEPGTPEPGTPEPGTPEPGTPEPGTSEPGTSEPGTSEPGTSEPGTSEPGTSEPGTSEPGTSEPGTSEPGTSEPGTSEPGTSEPGTSEPGTSEPGTSEPGTPEPGQPEPPTGPLHPMDKTDIVLATARGDYGRIGDYYTRDRSTPQRDEFYRGTQSLTAALVYEEGDTTVAVFRKPLKSNEETDYDIEDRAMHVIWARGQERGHYRRDELKYHGTVAPQRGVTSINFLDTTTPEPTTKPKTPKPEPSPPVGTSPKNQGAWVVAIDHQPFTVDWWYRDGDTMLDFLFSYNIGSQNKWVAIGFSDDTNMENTDAVVAWIQDDGITHITDRWITYKAAPHPDQSRDVTNASVSLSGGVVTVTFSRNATTNDTARDYQFSATNCPYVVHAVGGGYDPASGNIYKHSTTPVVTSSRVCFVNAGVAVWHLNVVVAVGCALCLLLTKYF